MNRTIKRSPLLVAFIIGLSMLLSIHRAQSRLTPKELIGALPAVSEKAPASLEKTKRTPVALSSNPRQVIDLMPAPTSAEMAALQTCGLKIAGLSDAEIDPYKGPLDCTGQSTVTLSEGFYGIFTYSGGRVSWWGGWGYGTMVNGAYPPGSQQCENPPLVISANRPISYWRQPAGCEYNQTITFTTNTGQSLQANCTSHNMAEVEFFGSNITQVTITSSPNTGTYISGPYFIDEQPCNCPNIPVVP